MTPRPKKSEKRAPGYPKSIQKGVKKRVGSHPVYEKHEKVKSDENTCIYNGFSTFHHRISTQFPTGNVMKTHLEPNAEIQLPQAFEK